MAVRRHRLAGSTLRYAAMLAVALPLVFPFWWMWTSSLKSPAEIFAFPPSLFPEALRWENYAAVFREHPFARQYFNSVYIATLNVLGTLVVSSLAGYAFARIRFPGSGLLFVLLLSTLLMPAEVTIIPLFVLMRELDWLGTHLPLIVEPMFAAPTVVGTFLMRQHFLTFPQELEDAARIDGLGRFGILRHVALPLAGPTLATLAVLTFLSSWNSFLEPLIFLAGKKDLLTLPLALEQYVERIGGEPIWHVQLAATTLSVLPVILLFLVAQRYFVQGVSRVGVHG
jgi:multiple sugar transport system permease protein